MPIDYKRYPKNWEYLRLMVLRRADDKCEFCGVLNGDIGWRDDKGEFHPYTGKEMKAYYYEHCDGIKKGIKIVLTIAHLDHDEENENVSIDRLRALCQRCHLLYDANEKKRRIKSKKAIGDLFE